MKKITFMVLGMAAMIAVSCGEKKDAPKEGEATTTEAPAPEAAPEAPAASTEGNVVDKYIAVMEKTIEATAKNDQAALQALGTEYATLAQEFATYDPTSITKEQADKLATVSKKYAEAMMPK